MAKLKPELKLVKLIAGFLEKRGFEACGVHEPSGAFQDADIIAYGHDRVWIIEVKAASNPSAIRRGVEQLIKRMEKYKHAPNPVFLLICFDAESGCFKVKGQVRGKA